MLNNMLVPTPEGRVLEAELNDCYAATGNIGRTLAQYDDMLAEHARNMSWYGISHRNFLVGGNVPALMLYKWAERESMAALLRMAKPVGRIILLEGANNSPVEGFPRDCPEISFAKEGDRLNDVIGRAIFLHLYTAGPGSPQAIKSVTGLAAATLPPCDTCRPLLWKCAATWPKMPVTTLAHDGPAREDNILSGIVDRYSGTQPPPHSEAIKSGLVRSSSVC